VLNTTTITVETKMSSKPKNPDYYAHVLKILFVSIVFTYFIVTVSTAEPAHMDALNNSCVECHKTLSRFTDEQVRLNEIRIKHIEENNASCSLECHEDVIRRRASDNYQQWYDSEHSTYYVTCDACHGGDPASHTEEKAHAAMKEINDLASPIYFKNIPDTCGKCHAEEIDKFKNTMHYQRLGATASGPSCITCHKTHSFKVLKSSELTVVCSVCHNLQNQIATAKVPSDAKNALEKQEELKKEILKARIAIDKTKASGKDVPAAELYLEKAKNTLDGLPHLWHGFDLKNFDKQAQEGIDLAKKAEYEASGVEPEIPVTPGIGIIPIAGILSILYLIRQRE
jgi:hypothetical protein